ncbi:ubiquitin-like domain-containing protein [Streptomyces sp. NPDC019645]|uniref:ubiquitin-like domain-containing protein n=1 Tax=Streptomyces sp. NPDC019645 TaxID=3154786 RepID=UPI0033DD8E56
MEPPPPPVPPAPVGVPPHGRAAAVSPYAPTVTAFRPGAPEGPPGGAPRAPQDTGPAGRPPAPGAPGRPPGAEGVPARGTAAPAAGPAEARRAGPANGTSGTSGAAPVAPRWAAASARARPAPSPVGPGAEAPAFPTRAEARRAGPANGTSGTSGAAPVGPHWAPAATRVEAAPTPTGGRAAGRAEARRAARRRKSGAFPLGGPDGLRRLIPQALVVAFLAGGTTAFVAADKAVRLSVDGVPRTLHTFADDVDELLAEEGLTVGEHDLVAPAPGTDLAHGDEVVVRFGRPVTLTVDGRSRQVWTTARTVEEALRQVGVRANGASMSVSRSRSISRTGLDVDVLTERTVTLMADGRARTIRTNAATAREAVEAAGITLGDLDTTSVPPDSFPRDGQTITVMRISDTEEVRDEPIPYDTVRTDDPELHRGTEVVARAGRAGARRVTYSVRTVNGVRQKPRKVSEAVVREPVAQQVRTGTKRHPDSVRGAEGLNWEALAQCESGGRPDAVDPSGTYGGLYQFDTRTWQSLGGRGRPQDASPEEQTYRAKKLYVQRGASPWPHCGRRLYR